jgi:hypothetical protein
VCRESWRWTDDLKEVVPVRVGPDAEGDRERRRDWNGGLQQPSGLNCPRDACASQVGYHRCHGETRAVECPRTLKSVLESSVRNIVRRFAARCSQSLVDFYTSTGYVRDGRATVTPRNDGSPCCQGYSWSPNAPRVCPSEHENLDSSAEHAKLGKLPSPATSRTRGGAFVVVGARESRAHGEGR